MADLQHSLASFGTYLEIKKYLAELWNLVLVFLLNFGTIFGGKLDENQPKKCRKVKKSEFGFTCSQCKKLFVAAPHKRLFSTDF